MFELTAALGLATFIILISQVVAERQRNLVAADTWFRVNEVFVPDHTVGQNPKMIYDRMVFENFNGFWIAEVQVQTKSGLWTTSCSGYGVNEYDPTEVIENNTVDWDWYVGKDCQVQPGTYRIRTTYTMTRPGWPEKQIFSLSNVFKVLPS